MKKTTVNAIFSPDCRTECLRPLYVTAVPAGFPSPADDYIEGQLDLNKFLIQRPAATYFVRVTGDSMIDAGIHDGDLLIVDRSCRPKDKDVVIAAVNGELTVKRMRIKNRRITLVPENRNYTSQSVSDEEEFEIWGVVRHVIHSL